VRKRRIGKWLRVSQVPVTAGERRKTARWTVFSDKGDVLGVVCWYSPWRRYCFRPRAETIFEEVCLRDLSTFLNVENVCRGAKKWRA
jgi:hypothetical protein